MAMPWRSANEARAVIQAHTWEKVNAFAEPKKIKPVKAEEIEYLVIDEDTKTLVKSSNITWRKAVNRTGKIIGSIDESGFVWYEGTPK